MSKYEGQQILTLPAGAALDDGVFVKVSSNTWVLATATDCEGVTLHSAANGDDVNVCIAGPCDVRTTSALTVGSEVEADANSRAITATGTASRVRIGLAEEAGGTTTSSIAHYAKILLPVIKTVN
jgi:hypothetical protein